MSIFLQSCIVAGYSQRQEDMHPMYLYLNNELHEHERFVEFEKKYPQLLAKAAHPGFADSIYTYGLLSDYYNKYGRLDKADSIISILSGMTLRAKNNNDPAWLNYDEMLLSTQALNLAYKGDYHAAIEKLDARKTTPRSASQVNQWLGEIYFRGGQYTRAERYLAQSIDSFKMNDLINRWPVDAYVFSANALIKLGHLPQALDRLNKAAYYKKWVTKYTQRFLYNYYNAWIDYHLAAGSMCSTIAPYYKKLKALPAMQDMPQLPMRQAEFENLCGDKSKVLQLLNQSLKKTLAAQSTNITLMSNIHTSMAMVYSQIDSGDLAKKHMIEAISLFTGQSDEQLWSAVSWEIIFNRIGTLGALDIYFRFLKKGLTVQADRAQLEHLAALARWAMSGMLSERNKYVIGDDKTTLIGYNQKIIELGIYTNGQLFKLTKDRKYLDSLFEFIECNKSLNLAEEIARSGVRNHETTNPAESDKIDSLKNVLVNLERSSIHQPNNVTLISRIASLYDTLDHLLNLTPYTLQEPNKSLQLFKTFTLTEVRSRIPKTLSILEFYEGIDNVYILLIQHDMVDFKMYPRSKNLDDLILDYRGALTAPTNAVYSFHSKRYDSTYLASASELFKLIVGDWEKILTKQLLIIPDGSFHLIPFASLLISPATFSRFKELPYWINDHVIQYAHSASIWMQLSDIPSGHPLRTVLAMAPFANQELRESAYELEQIARYTRMKSLLDEQATKQIFCQIAPDYKILHLATHAYSNAADGASSCISFYKKNTLDSQALRQTDPFNASEDSFNYLLDVRDVRNLVLHADMVVLSACESGIGEWKEGEGVISLARGFMSAGARSVVQTLWQVHDKANAVLMASFYDHLSKGEEKGAALRRAQLDYISGPEIGQRQAHPFYWAGVVLQGNNLALEAKTGLPTIILILALAMCSIWVYTYYRKKHIAASSKDVKL